MAQQKKPKASAPPTGLPAFPEDIDFVVMSDGVDNDNAPIVDPETGTIQYEDDDGNIIIQLGEPKEEEDDDDFDANLALKIEEFELGRIAETLLEGIEADQRSYSDWVQERADGLELLGMKVEKPGVGNVGSASTAVVGQSTVRDALLAEACDRFQANSFAELCPAEGPCKVVCYGSETAEKDALADQLERDINFYLTGSGGKDTATEYYPDTRRMLWWVGYSSGMFKKVYWCPLRDRPVSEAVDGTDLIVNANVTDLHNAGRITHVINMRQSVMKRMQILDVYRDVDLTTPTPSPNALVQKTADIVGGNPTYDRPEDQDYTIYECYCEIDLIGYEHKQDGKESGLALPYRVTIDKDSRKILEIRRNWKPEDADDAAEKEEDDDGDPLPSAQIPFVQFNYATGLGFYGTGLLQRLGNYTMALTAMLRECIDAGMYASFPGFLYAKPAGRQLQNEFRVPPGGGAAVDVSAVGGDINKAVMALPYKDVSPALVGLMEQTRQNGMRYGGTAEAPTGEGVANAPVGSVLAAIDQATKVEGGVHKALYASQREELGKMLDLFRRDPSVIWRGNKRPAMGGDPQGRVKMFTLALQQYDLVPASDPNVPSHMHRLAKANAYVQMVAMVPQLFNLKRVIMRWAKMLKIDGVESDFAPDGAGQPEMDPAEMAKIKIQQQNADTQLFRAQSQAAHQKAQLESKENIEALKFAAGGIAEAPQAEMPDPFAADEIKLKRDKLGLDAKKLESEHYNKQEDRESKENIEVLKLVQSVAVHPTSDAVVDQQLQDMSPFLTPSNQQAVRAGGVVSRTKDPKADKIAAIAAELTAMLRGGEQSSYTS